MCADCRVITMSEQQFDPFAGVAERAAPRTTDDYLRERETQGMIIWRSRAPENR